MNEIKETTISDDYTDFLKNANKQPDWSTPFEKILDSHKIEFDSNIMINKKRPADYLDIEFES